MINSKHKNSVIISLMVLLTVVMSMIITAFTPMTKVKAGNVIGARLYTNVLTDLQKDNDFNVNDYPVKTDGDYSMQVIQLGENTDNKEVYIYTYEPRRKDKPLDAICVNMSLSDTVDNSKLYDLQLINENGVFCKYKVLGVTVDDSKDRYYNITSILRTYNQEADGDNVGGEYTNAKAFPVAKCYKVTGTGKNITYAVKEMQVITIYNLYTGHLRYANGSSIFASYDLTDAWFMAFDTDIVMDQLLSATVSFTERKVNEPSLVGLKPSYTITHYDNYNVNYIDTGSSTQDKIYWFAPKQHSWNRIQTTDEFVAMETTLQDDTKKKLAGTRWVIRFYETPYTSTYVMVLNGQSYNVYNYSQITDETILTLTFLKDGIVYKMGAVCDKVTPDRDPDNDTDFDPEDVFPKIPGFGRNDNLWKIILIVLAIILLLVLLGATGLLPTLLKAIVWLICAPFKLIAKGVKAIKKKVDKSKDNKQNAVAVDTKPNKTDDTPKAKAKHIDDK